MEYAITELEIYLGVLENNAPINEREGKLEQAALERTAAVDIRRALDLLRQNSDS